MSKPSDTCICAQWPDRQIINLGSETATLLDDHFDRLAEQSPWIYLVRCRGCGQRWYAAVDTVDDDYYFRRLGGDEVAAISDGTWPSDFDQFVNVWPPVRGEDHHARVRRPWQTSAGLPKR
jgi:hypothetical protein